MKKTVLISMLFILGACSEKIEPKINPSVKPSEIKISSSPKTEPTVSPSIVTSIIPITSILPSPQISTSTDLCCPVDKITALVYGKITDKNGNIVSNYHIKVEILDSVNGKKLYESDDTSDGSFLIRGVVLEPKEIVSANLTIEKNKTPIYKSQITIVSNSKLNGNLNYFDIKLTE